MANAELRVVTEPERRVHQAVARPVGEIHRLSLVAQEARKSVSPIAKQLAALNEEHPEYARPNRRQVSLWWGLLCALVGVLAMDIVLSWPTSTYYATKFVNLGPYAWTAGLLLPLSLFLFELFVIAGHRIEALDAAMDGLLTAYHGWTVVGIIISLTVPLLTLAAQLSVAEVTYGTSVPWSQVLKIAGLTVMGVLLHAAVCFSGQSVQDAKGYASYRWQARRFQRKIDAAETAVRGAALRATTLHQTAGAQIAAARRAGISIEDPRFSQAAADLINGVDVQAQASSEPTTTVPSLDAGPIGTPSGAGGDSRTSTASGPAETRADDTLGAAHDEWADTARVRDADGEVVI
jgi:hypothetical protein